MENNSVTLKEDLIKWIKNWYASNAPNDNTPIIVGVSGGVISNVMLCLLVSSLLPSRVIAVTMRSDKNIGVDKEANDICDYVKVKQVKLPVFPAINCLKNVMTLDGKVRLSEQAINNLPARMRMVTLYAYSQSVGGFVASTQTLSDMFIGYNTIYGDGCGDFAPFANLTRTEIMQVGLELGMSEKFLHIVPDDGLPASIPDESKLHFTYKQLDKYIRTGEIEDIRAKALIDRYHAVNRFKRFKTEAFNPELYIYQP